MLKVGYLGPNGTFTKMAVNFLFEGVSSIPFQTIPSCMDAVKKGDVDFGVVPLENTIEGSVNLTIDYLIHEQTLPIVGEIVVPIKQHLMVHPQNKERINELQSICSHSHAIAQCHQFIHKNMPNAEIDYKKSTAAAAKYVQAHPAQLVAAIANDLAAKEYGLEIVKENIHDYENNHTRFLILHNKAKQLDKNHELYVGDRTTLMIMLPKDYAGALHTVLSAFSWRKLNLSKIESRPMKTGLGNYFFIVDVEMSCDEVLLPGAIAEIEALGCKVKTLGSYPYFHAKMKVSNGC